MASDLKIDIDGIRLNVRAGVIMRYNDQVVIEISKIGLNSVVPGGRVQINERSSATLVREVFEEMNFNLEEKKLKQVKVFENFFGDEKKFHEIYFLYEYILNEEEYKKIRSVYNNKDNSTTYFEFVSKFKMKENNVLPLEIHDIIER